MERNYATVTLCIPWPFAGGGRKCRRLLLAGSPGGRRPVGLWTGRSVLGASRGPPASQWRPHTVHAVANNRAAAAELAACISRRFSFKLTLNRRPQTDRLTNGHGRQAGRGTCQVGRMSPLHCDWSEKYCPTVERQYSSTASVAAAHDVIHRSVVLPSSPLRRPSCDECPIVACVLLLLCESHAQFTPPARYDKTVLSVSCRAAWIESRDCRAKSEQLADRSPSSRGV